MDAKEVDIRGFGANIAEYVASDTTVAVIQEGRTVGYFIPTPEPDEADDAALEQAAEEFDRSLAGSQIDIEAAVAEFYSLPKSAARPKKLRSKAA
ncbi:MAG: type II toxin-antitoxin system Phd/YefM family antitoxin [Pseudomonadota bacterium]|nr:type II toxin-antitoxin system Phd/YefM family antitoxin [Pseudomonadota bacterium]